MTITTKAWTHPASGAVRHYIQATNIAEYLGFAIIKDNYGDIKYLLHGKGEKVPAGMIEYILTARLWVDENNKLHLSNFWAGDIMSEEEALANAYQMIAEEGGLDIEKELGFTLTPETEKTTEDSQETITAEEIDEAQRNFNRANHFAKILAPDTQEEEMTDPKLEFILSKARELREKHGEPEAIDLSIYSSEESLRKAGVQTMTLAEHTDLIEQAADLLEEDGFTVNIHQVPAE